MALLQGLNRHDGMTVIIVTHDAEVAAHAHRVVSMRDGVIVDDVPVEYPREASPAVPEGGPE